MKSVCLFIVLLTIHLPASGDVNTDHLLPLNPTWSPRYREILTEKLGLTSFDSGRVIFRPPFEKPEESVSIYSEGSARGRQSYKITYVVAEENIWDATGGGEFPERAKNIKVRRIDAEISDHIAHMLKRIWLAMLQGVRGQFPPAVEEREMIPGDPTQIEFSLERSNAPPLSGQLNVFLENHGNKVKSLLRVSDDLVSYCKATPNQRFAISGEIDKEATRFLSQLK
jgi:hypothetical protein